MQKIEGETYRSTKAGPGWWAGCLVKSHDPMIDPSLVLQRRYEEKGELSSLEGSSNCSFTVDHHQAENARFPPLAEIPTAQPCQWVAEKVSLVPLACSVSEGVDYSRPSLQVNGTRPRLCTTNRSYNKFIVHSPLILTRQNVPRLCNRPVGFCVLPYRPC